MRKKYIILILIMFFVFCVSACTKTDEVSVNEAINQVGKAFFNNEDDIVVLVLNNLDEQMLDIYRNSINIEEYGSSINESALFVPKYNNMKISVYNTEINDNKVEKNKLLYETKYKENYGFLFHNDRPEGIPLIITVEGNGISVDYYYSYNGKDGTPDFEYIKANQKDVQ